MSKNKSSGEKRQQLLEMRSILDSDLRQQGHCALATQRRAVQEAAAQERAVIASLAAGLAPCVGQEAALVREVEQAEADVISVGEEHYRIIGDDDSLKQVAATEWLSQLVVKNARLEDRGMYICFVTSGGQAGGFNFKQSYLSVIESKLPGCN